MAFRTPGSEECMPSDPEYPETAGKDSSIYIYILKCVLYHEIRNDVFEMKVFVPNPTKTGNNKRYSFWFEGRYVEEQGEQDVPWLMNYVFFF